MSGTPLLVFDVNETLLDIDALEPHFERMFGDRGVMRAWFAQLILYSEAITLADTYAPFGDLGAAVLRMVGATHGVQVSEADTSTLREAVATLPPHPDVPPALKKLKAAGFRLFALTNNPRSTCQRQLRHAGIEQLFDRQFSVDEAVHRYKPAPEVYREVQTSLGVPTEQLCLVACHTWDILGAAAQGWRTAMILRPGNAALAVGGQPDFSGDDLEGIARTLVDRYAPGNL